MPHLFRSLIFVPGNNRRFLDKARDLEADIVCLDLEDSVPEAQKEEAREMISTALDKGEYRSEIFVRTNSPASQMIPADLEAVVGSRPDGLVIPKVDGPADLDGVLDVLGKMGPAGSNVKILPSIESAAGVVNSYAISSHGPQVCAVVFGIFDLLNDMGMEYTKDPSAAAYARSKIPVDAAAAGVPAIDGIWQDIRDTDGFVADCRLGRSVGYSGKSLIHPGQIEVAHREFRPTQREILWARRVCETYLDTVDSGRGATTVDGKMIDEVHYKRARAVLELTGGAE